MVILGFNGGVKFEHEEAPVGYRGHDSSAVLMRDGEVIAAIEEERLIRLKHTNCFPAHAIRWCLNAAGVDWSDVDRIATNMSRGTSDRLASLEFWTDAKQSPLRDAAGRLGDLFQRAFAVDVTDRLRFCHHHVAHAWSAFVPSGFERSLILSIDGAGDDTSGMVLLGRDRQITKLRDYGLQQSLGHFYLELIRWLGYCALRRIQGDGARAVRRSQGLCAAARAVLRAAAARRLSSRAQTRAGRTPAGGRAARRFAPARPSRSRSATSTSRPRCRRVSKRSCCTWRRISASARTSAICAWREAWRTTAR